MNIELNQENKATVLTLWHALDQKTSATIQAAVEAAMDPSLVWYGFDPLNELRGQAAFVSDFWLPLQESFSGLTRQTHIFCAGESNGRIDGDLTQDGRMWVSGTGYLRGIFDRDYLGIPASAQPVAIRWGEFCRLERGKIVEIYMLLDLVDLMQQAGCQVLPPSRGRDHLYPPPRAEDGVLLEAQDATESAYSRTHLRRFIFDGLNQYDQSELGSMGMADFFHPQVQWYGPGGIGACLSLKEFEDYHQRPWLHAFPDRQVQDLTALFAEGPYSAAPGWAGVKATHAGAYLEVPATGNSVVINGLDWWKRQGEQYVENWVFVDMIHLFRQFGVDLFARLAAPRKES